MMQASEILSRIHAARDYIRSLTDFVPELGIVAGSGLGALAGLVENAVHIPYGDIPHAHAPTVVGHAGELVLGTLDGLKVAVLSGRVHGYEGHALDEVVFNVRLVALLGAKRFLLTNAAGGIEPWMHPGSLCVITDQLNLTGQNVLTGPNVEAFGPRFPDMSTAYCPELTKRLVKAGEAAGVSLLGGVYAGLTGPTYETPAEIRMLRVLGASLVGMSTVQECIALNHMGVKVVGLSCVTNYAAGVSNQALDHAEVAETAKVAGPKLLALVRSFARELAENHA